MTAFEKLSEKIDIEISEFKSHYEGLSPMAVYNDSYKINFFESFKNMLSNDYIDNDYNGKVIAWLSEKNSPIDFLHEMYMGSDGEMSYDWDDMMEWVKGVYFEEKRLEKQELHYEISSLGLKDVPISNDEYFEGFECFVSVGHSPVVFSANFPGSFDENINAEFGAFFRERLLVKSCDYGCDTYPGGVTKIRGELDGEYTFRQEVWNFIEAVEQMFNCKCDFIKGYNGFEFAFEFGSDNKKGCYVFAAGNNGQEFTETLYLTDLLMIRDPQIANTIISIDKALYTLLEENLLRREDRVASLDEVIKGAEEQKNEQKVDKGLNVEQER